MEEAGGTIQPVWCPAWDRDYIYLCVGVGGCLGEWVLTAGISRASLNRLKVRRSSARRLLFPWESACVLNTCQIQSRMSVHALHVIICNIGHFLLSPLPLNANLATGTRAHTHTHSSPESFMCVWSCLVWPACFNLLIITGPPAQSVCTCARRHLWSRIMAIS